MKKSRIVLFSCGFVALTALAACGDKSDDREARPAKLMTSQRDSVTAASRLPGAAAVRGVLVEADSAAARAARVNEASR